MATITKETHVLVPAAAQAEGQQNSTMTAFKYGEDAVVSLFPTKHAAALRGYYYGISLASTAVVTSLTALTEASPALIIENTAPTGGPNIMMDYVRVYFSAVAAAGTDLQGAWKVDNIRNKWASAGSAITPQNMNPAFANASVANVHAGALVVATAQQSSTVFARTIYNAFMKPTATAPAQIIGDTFDFRFGALEAPLPTVLNNVASAGANTFPLGLCVALPPVILTPGTTLTFFTWGSNNGSAASIMLNGGWYEY